jgi:hypothetical protein
MSYKVKPEWENAVVIGPGVQAPTVMSALSQEQLAALYAAGHPGIDKIEKKKNE